MVAKRGATPLGAALFGLPIPPQIGLTGLTLPLQSAVGRPDLQLEVSNALALVL